MSSALVVSLILAILTVALLLLALVAVAFFFPASPWREQARAILAWRPPFMRGEELSNWAATTAEQTTRNRLVDKRTARTPVQLAKESQEGAMRAMVPLAKEADLSRVVACPETGQGMVGLTAPEALAVAAYLRKNCSGAELNRIYELAVEN